MMLRGERDLTSAANPATSLHVNQNVTMTVTYGHSVRYRNAQMSVVLGEGSVGGVVPGTLEQG